MKMMGFLLFFAFAHEIEELVACLSLVKWKIDNDEGSFDTILASTALEHEKVIDKVIGNMLETCANQITKEIKEAENKMFVYNFNHYFTKSLQI